MRPCPTLLAYGSCQEASCRLNHDVHVCTVCDVVSTSLLWHQQHLAGRQHQKRLKGRRETPQGAIHCSACDVYIPPAQWPKHLSGFKHANKTRTLAFLSVLAEATKDKHGITVSDEDGMDLGVVDLQQTESRTFTVSTHVPYSSVVLVDVKLSSGSRSSFIVDELRSPVPVRSIQTLRFNVMFASTFRGRYQDRLEFVFEDRALLQRFVIVRTIRAISGEPGAHADLQPSAPYVPRKWAPRTRESNVIPGVRPPALTAVPWVVPLPDAIVPHALADAVASGAMRDVISQIRQSFLPPALNGDTYARHFKTLLWVEEVRMEEDLRIYDMDATTLSTYLPYYFLPVPGLAEKRPSVLVGDRILVRRQGMVEGQWFEGGVHVVRQAEVGLRFNTAFRGHTPATRYEVHFKLNRYPTRRQHQALDCVWAEARVLFPDQRHLASGGRPAPRTSTRLYNAHIDRNPPQLQAVTSIVQQAPGSVPFVVFGPPGTGKTVTVVEAMLQLLRQKPTTRILACAPSNSAADIIAERLARQLNSDELFRFYAPSRFKNQVPNTLHDHIYETADGHFSVPPMARMKRFRVVVCTCVSASMPYGIGMPRGHFTHIFVDEAGQATEPEVAIPIKTMCDRSTNIVLSGDPRQLGPIIRSVIAQKLGLEISLLERLMQREIYTETTGYGVTMVKLVQNFRSHAAILKFPNDRFYNGDLEECGDQRIIDSFIGWPKLPRPEREFPIIFHAIHGKDDRESTSPSFFNIDEVLQVKAYVNDLRSDRKARLTDHDIGIVTPYHAQVVRIRNSLRGVADQVKVGSVEEFQGQERRVIIISTVRSSREFVEYDLRHTLGFVASPRRFNVAVTRAQALLIVVGDPDVLGLDPLWRGFLNYVRLEGGWTGPAMSWDPRDAVRDGADYAQETRDRGLADMNELARRMEAVALGASADGEVVEATVDRPWREDE